MLGPVQFLRVLQQVGCVWSPTWQVRQQQWQQQQAQRKRCPNALGAHHAVQASPAARLLNWPGAHWRGAGSQAGLEVSTTGHVQGSCQKMRLRLKEMSILPLPAWVGRAG